MAVIISDRVRQEHLIKSHAAKIGHQKRILSKPILALRTEGLPAAAIDQQGAGALRQSASPGGTLTPSVASSSPGRWMNPETSHRDNDASKYPGIAVWFRGKIGSRTAVS